jgi:signal peptidase I
MSEQKAKEEEQTPKTLKEKTIAFLKEAGIIIGLFLIINNFVIASFLVPTGSMENEVLTGELLFVNKFIYGGTSPLNLQQLDLLQIFSFGNLRMPNVPLPWFRLPAFRDVRRGDVIVFVFPGYRDDLIPEEFQFYLKRCIGISGDTIQIKNRVIHVNGQIVPLPRHVRFDRGWSAPSNEPDDRIFPAGSGWNEDNYGPLVVPKKGDKISLDVQISPSWLVFIRREGHTAVRTTNGVLVDGKIAESYTVERDYVFGMGDHRDNSLDGRFWGFIPKESLVGTPIIVYWSWDTNIPLYDIFGRLASVRWGRIGSLIK